MLQQNFDVCRSIYMCAKSIRYDVPYRARIPLSESLFFVFISSASDSSVTVHHISLFFSLDFSPFSSICQSKATTFVRSLTVAGAVSILSSSSTTTTTTMVEKENEEEINSMDVSLFFLFRWFTHGSFLISGDVKLEQTRVSSWFVRCYCTCLRTSCGLGLGPVIIRCRCFEIGNSLT